MARDGRWSRYQPPSERRSEDGGPVGGPRARPKPKPKPASKPKQSTPKSTRSSTRSSTPKTGGGTRFLIGLAVLVPVVVAIIVAVQVSGDDDGVGNPDIDTSVLNETFVGRSLEGAAEDEGRRAVSVRLDEYGMTVEYYEPNERESRYYETRSYSDGHTVRVEPSYYEDYQPRPFDLAVVSSTDLIEAVEEALADAEDAYTFSARVEADRETGEVSLVVQVSADENVELTRELGPAPPPELDPTEGASS